MKSEIFRKGDTGYNVEEKKLKMVRDGTRVDTGHPLPQTAQQCQL